MCQSLLGIQRHWAGDGVIEITIILINLYHSALDWCHCRGFLALSAKDCPVSHFHDVWNMKIGLKIDIYGIMWDYLAVSTLVMSHGLLKTKRELVTPEMLQIPHPWKCPRLGWTGLGATWNSGTCPFPINIICVSPPVLPVKLNMKKKKIHIWNLKFKHCFQASGYSVKLKEGKKVITVCSIW